MNLIIDFALKQRVLVVALMCLVFVGGAIGFWKLNIEAYPDPVPPLVDIITQSSGQSAEEIERYITIPIEVQMTGIPDIASIRTISLFGLSDVKIQFTYATTYKQAEQRVINRLSQLTPLPNSAQPQISPTSPIGEIYRYRLVGPARLSRRPIENPAGLGTSTAVQSHPWSHRRDRLGRNDQDLRRHRGPEEADGAGCDARSGVAGAEQQQRQRRWSDGEHRPPIRCRSWRGTDSFRRRCACDSCVAKTTAVPSGCAMWRRSLLAMNPAWASPVRI